MDQATKDQQLMKAAMNAFKRLGLPIRQKGHTESRWEFSTGIVNFDGGPAETISVTYESIWDFILITETLAWPVSCQQTPPLLEINNRLNNRQVGGSFYFDEKQGVICVSNGFFINNSHFEELTFEKTLGCLLKLAENIFPLLQDFLKGNKSKEDVCSEILLFKMEERSETEAN